MKPRPLEPMLNYTGLAKLLGIGVRTAKRWVSEGVLPAPDLRLRGVVRWHPSTIRAWIERNRSGVANTA